MVPRICCAIVLIHCYMSFCHTHIHYSPGVFGGRVTGWGIRDFISFFFGTEQVHAVSGTLIADIFRQKVCDIIEWDMLIPYSPDVLGKDHRVTGVTSRGMCDFVVLFLHDIEEDEKKGGTWVCRILIADGATPEHHLSVDVLRNTSHSPHVDLSLLQRCCIGLSFSSSSTNL